MTFIYSLEKPQIEYFIQHELYYVNMLSCSYYIYHNIVVFMLL